MQSVYKIRGLLMLPPVLFALLCTWNEVENDVLVFGLGGLIFGLGVLIRTWSQMHLHYRLRIKKVLTTTGPYRYCRNPIYIGNTMILLGFVMMTEVFWFLPVMLIYCMIVYTLVVRYEESYLRQKFGAAYEDYLSQVPRWIPTFRVFQNTALTETRNFLIPSIIAELHCLLLLLPVVAKELVV